MGSMKWVGTVLTSCVLSFADAAFTDGPDDRNKAEIILSDQWFCWTVMEEKNISAEECYRGGPPKVFLTCKDGKPGAFKITAANGVIVVAGGDEMPEDSALAPTGWVKCRELEPPPAQERVWQDPHDLKLLSLDRG